MLRDIQELWCCEEKRRSQDARREGRTSVSSSPFNRPKYPSRDTTECSSEENKPDVPVELRRRETEEATKEEREKSDQRRVAKEEEERRKLTLLVYRPAAYGENPKVPMKRLHFIPSPVAKERKGTVISVKFQTGKGMRENLRTVGHSTSDTAKDHHQSED